MIKTDLKKNRHFKTIITVLKNEGVKKIGLFGSYAKGKASAKSDIDLLVDFSKKKSLLDIVRIERELFEKLNKKIDLCTRKSISPYLIHSIKKQEMVLYER